MRRRQLFNAEVRVRVPESQDPFVIVNGKVFISILWSFGGSVDVPITELCKLLANTRGTVIVARQLNGSEQRQYLQSRSDAEIEMHARLIRNEAVRWHRPR